MMLIKSKFTLVEAMVVMALISILVSLLSPTLRKFSKHAHEVSCSVGVRNLINVSHAYAEDSDGYFPDIQQHPKNKKDVVGVAFFAFRYWADLLEQDYGLSRENWYSPSNPDWSFEMFYQYNKGVHMVMGRTYYGAKALQGMFESTILPTFKGSPTFAARIIDLPSQNVLWTDINRKLSGTDSFVNPISGGVKNGANHLYDLNGNWPELSHNGKLDGSVELAFGEEIKVRFKNIGSVNHW